jgi:hypothetical protein
MLSFTPVGRRLQFQLHSPICVQLDWFSAAVVMVWAAGL